VHLFADKDGNFYKQFPGQADRIAVTLPTGVAQYAPFQRPSFDLAPDADMMIFVGQWTANLAWFRTRQALALLGIWAGTTALTVAAGVGSGITGDAIYYYAFAEYDETGHLVHESSLSPPSATVSGLTNDSVNVSAIPTTHVNARVNFVNIYTSRDGDDPLLVATLPLGTSTYSDTTPTNSLPEIVGADDNDPPPRATLVAIFHGRAWYVVGNRIYFSKLGKYESVPYLNFIPTLDRQPITCLRALSDQLVIGTRRSIQYLTGWSNSDFDLKFTTRAFGIVSHWASKVINDRLWAFTPIGYVLVAGDSYRYLMPTLRSYFFAAYKADKSTYEDAIAEIDPKYNVLEVLIPKSSAFYYIGHYMPMEIGLGGSGTTPFWTFDQKNRKDYTLGLLSTDGFLDERYVGSCDGYVRTSDETNANDDGDTYAKALTIAGKHDIGGDQSGRVDHSKTLERIGVHVKSEQVGWTLGVYAGDDSAYTAASATKSIPVSASAQVKNGRTAIAKTYHDFVEVKCAGKGFTTKITASSPLGFEFRGEFKEWKNEGENPRPEAA
jgi:hypothetical protein